MPPPSWREAFWLPLRGSCHEVTEGVRDSFLRFALPLPQGGWLFGSLSEGAVPVRTLGLRESIPLFLLCSGFDYVINPFANGVKIRIDVAVRKTQHFQSVLL